MMFVAWPVREACEILPHRRPAGSRVVLRDRHQQEGHDQAHDGREVEIPEGEAARVERHRHRDEAERRQERRDQHGLVERIHDRAAATDARAERSDHRGEDRDPADRQRIEPQLRHRVRLAQQHDGDRGDGVGLEQVRGHPGAVADVVADVVRDHGWVPWVVLGDPGLDLADEVGADVGGLGVDAAAETREDRDQRPAEREPDEVLDRRVGRVVEPDGQHAVVAGHSEQAEPDDEQPRDRPGAEGDVQRRLEPVLGGLGGAHVRAHGDVHPDEPGRRGEDGADHEPDRRPPAELVVEADQEERDDRDQCDRRVLAAQIGRGPLLDRARDLLHARVSGRLAQQPDGEPDAEGNRDARADEGEENGVVAEKVDRRLLTNSAPDTRRAALFYHTS